MKNESSEVIGAEKRQSITFHYIKSNYFRVIHADGVWGGVTPHLSIQMAFFSERSPIPQLIKYSLESDGQVGKEMISERVTREGVVREIEASVVVDLDTAKMLKSWLEDKIAQAEKIKATNHQEEIV